MSNLIIEVPIASCERIKERSGYNHNFYRLPFKINGMDILYEVSDDDNSSAYYLCEHLGSDAKRVPIGGDTIEAQHKHGNFIFHTEDYGRYLS